MVTRRGFFGRVGAGVVGGLIMPHVLPLDVLTWTGRTPAGGTIVGLEAMTAHVVARLATALKGLRPVDVLATRLEAKSNGWGQFSFMLPVNYLDDIVIARDLDPAVAALADSVRLARGFGVLPLPQSVERAVTVRDDRVCVRGLQDYDIFQDRMLTRFDVLCEGA